MLHVNCTRPLALTLAGLLLWSSACGTGTGPSQAPSQSSRELGREALADGRFDEARTHFEAALRVASARGRASPDYLRVQLDLADVEAARGALPAARLHLRLAQLAMDRSSVADAEPHERIGTLYSALGEQDRAILALETALAAETAETPDPSTLARRSAKLAHAEHLLGLFRSAEQSYRLGLEAVGRSGAEGAALGTQLSRGLARLYRLEDRADEADELLAGLSPDDDPGDLELARLEEPVVRERLQRCAQLEALFYEAFEREHYRPKPPELAEMLIEGCRRHGQGKPAPQLDYYVAGELGKSVSSFAPRDAVHDDSVRYRLPFELGTAHMMIRGPGELPTHGPGSNRHAYDFALPIGTPVLAARAGTVVRILDGFERRLLTAGQVGREANTLMLLHSDGTFALYTHLSPGIELEEGAQVQAGDLLARSGETGYADGPHLHFAVQACKPHRAYCDVYGVPILFTDLGDGKELPRLAEFYPTTASERDFATAREARGGRTVPWGSDDSQALPDDPEEASAVRSAYAAYARPMVENNVPKAAAAVDRATFDYFDDIRKRALHTPRDELESAPMFERALVLLTRQAFSAAKLERMSGKELLVAALERGWLGQDSLEQIRIGLVSIDGDQASGEFVVRGQPIPGVNLNFAREEGRWRVRLAEVLARSNEGMEQIAVGDERGQTLVVVALLGRHPVDPGLWQPKSP